MSKLVLYRAVRVRSESFLGTKTVNFSRCLNSRPLDETWGRKMLNFPGLALLTGFLL